MEIFESNIINIYGDTGRKWLPNLPYIVSDFAQRWHLSDLKPVHNLSYNYVLSGFQGIQPIILKLGLDVKSINTEGLALKAFKDHGAVKLLDQADGTLLLERATPGHPLKQLFLNHENEAIAIASEVIRKLNKMPKINLIEFPTINGWLTSLNIEYEILGKHLPKARALRDELLNTVCAPILLHGDLHHDNILAHGNEWKIIDPKGVVGELAYEVGCFIRNPLDALPSHHDCLKIIMNRINEFSKNLELNPHRIIKWCYVQNVLATMWALENNVTPSNFMPLTEIFDKLLVQSF